MNKVELQNLQYLYIHRRDEKSAKAFFEGLKTVGRNIAYSIKRKFKKTWSAEHITEILETSVTDYMMFYTINKNFKSEDVFLSLYSLIYKNLF